MMAKKPKKKIGIFVPLAFPFGMVPQEFFLSFFRANEYLLSRADDLPYEAEFQLFSPGTFPIDANRNQCVAIALENGIDITVWLDADQELADDTLYRLLVNGDKYPIYAGIYYLKKPPHHPIVFRAKKGFEVFYPIWRFPTKELFYADMIGMGCVKIDTEVFRKVEKPYFRYSAIPDEIAAMSDQMKFKHDNRVDDVSEDVAFWRQVKNKTDYRIVIDPQIQIGHITKTTITPEFVLRHSIANKKITQKQMGEEFDKYWDENLQRAELVNGTDPEAIEWVL